MIGVSAILIQLCPYCRQLSAKELIMQDQGTMTQLKNAMHRPLSFALQIAMLLLLLGPLMQIRRNFRRPWNASIQLWVSPEPVFK